MTNFIITNFSQTAPPLQIDINKELPESSISERHLKNSVKSILKYLKSMFFETNVFLSETLDNLNSLTESTLVSHFSVDISSQADDYASFEIIDSVATEAHPLIKVFTFLQNVRAIIGIMGNLFYNQIKIIVSTRVIYSKEDFNYETYLPKALSDSKLVKDVFFTKNGKNLVAEYFKYHKQQSNPKLTNFEMRSYNDIGILIVKLVTHVKELWEVSSCYDIEPLMCKK